MTKIFLHVSMLMLLCGPVVAQQTNNSDKAESHKVAKHHKRKKHRHRENGTADADRKPTNTVTAPNTQVKKEAPAY